MTSRRNVHDEVLDATRACVEAFGIRRTTLTDVARRAGVSRPTVYRRWPDVTSLVADLLTRELRAILLAHKVEHDELSTRDNVVAQATGVLRALLSHPLFTRIVDNEPELLATYTFQRLGTGQSVALGLLRPELEAGQRDGSIRRGDPDAMARMVLLVIQNTATSRRLTTDVMTEDQLVDEARVMLDGYLAPMSTTNADHDAATSTSAASAPPRE
ncbi:TetR/AcrR family transcriptional regulator [Nocardiopsis gilva YIM 90087]|uniref:TetR/AcrR family transcriptional regulator n=1 Tax=Nocardiopsis gilva YIM 90087 TaxID=1235441 RepID=A0A223SB65_9ACTN|nr:TetR/AcrR family transcriptional regulator [Nocardiopsis gilva]ASU85350.1 TetR/AcrR family transcriptional regulator [Nocardiopsis gilva YIM 90087]